VERRRRHPDHPDTQAAELDDCARLERSLAGVLVVTVDREQGMMQPFGQLL